MTFKPLLLISLFILLICTRGLSVRDVPNNPKISPFEFINNLKGCQKGSHTKGVHQLKLYLYNFGYLDKQNQTYLNNDEYDDALETAVKTYQQNFHIKSTGIIDDETASMISIPRCGVPDIVNGINYMQSHKQKESNSNAFHIIPNYNFLNGNPKWPWTDLTYWFLPNMPFAAMDPVARAFNTWARVSHFTFSLVQDYVDADLVIGFYKGDHGDGQPFDGPGGILAHSTAPTSGIFHFDFDEQWSIGAVPNAYDVETIANHEIGHLLGLGHSEVEEAIMYPSIGTGMTKGLHDDDINGLWALYNTV